MTDDAQGDLLAGVKLPATTARILFAGEIAEVKTERPDYLHRVLCQVGLPRSLSTELTFVRRKASASLLVEAARRVRRRRCRQRRPGRLALRWRSSVVGGPCRKRLIYAARCSAVLQTAHRVASVSDA